MVKSNRLIEELNKYLFLSGLKNNLFEASEENRLSKDANQDTQEETSTEDKKETEIVAKNKFAEYLGTNEEDFLNFPMKYAMVSTNAEIYLKDMEYLYLSLRHKNVPIRRIIQLIAPEKESAFTPSKFKKLEKSTREFLLALEDNIIRGKNGEVDKILKVNAGDELKQYNSIPQNGNDLNIKKENLKKDFQAASGDEKAIISYKLNAKNNDLKLTPLGFWQIQFLSRIFKQVPSSQNSLEAILFHSKAFGAYYNKAERTLGDFYKHAIYPMAAILTGRSYQINPNDHEFEIMLQNSWDKVKDQINKYDASRNNFGAWAFTVARNALIDQIKKITDYSFQSNIESKEAIQNQNLVYLHFNKNMNKIIPSELLEPLNTEIKEDAFEVKRQKTNSTFLYKFKSPEDLFNFLQMNEKNQSIFKSLSKISRSILNGLKVLHSVKKNSNVPLEKDEENFYDTYGEKAKGEERNKILRYLFTLYNNNADKFHAKKEDYSETAEYESMLDENGQRLYSNTELDEAFKQSVGMAFFYYQTEYVKNLPVIEKKVPGNVIDVILQKYTNILPQTTNVEINFKKEAFKFIDKTLRNANKGEFMSFPLLFKNRNINNPVIDELAPYIRYNYKLARSKKTSTEVTDSLKEEFVQRQEDEKTKEINAAKLEDRKPNPIYTFRNEVDKLFREPIANGLNGLLGLRRQKDDPNFVKNLETINKLSYTLSRLTGFNIKLEENNSIDEINNYLLEIKQKFIKKTLL